MVNETKHYIDRERFGDGSPRWLWRVVTNGWLWEAGIAANYEGCQRDSVEAYMRMMRAGNPPVELDREQAEQALVIDVDQLERPLPGEEGVAE